MKCFVLTLCVVLISCASQKGAMSADHRLSSLIKKSLPVFMQGETFNSTVDFTTLVSTVPVSNDMRVGEMSSSLTFVDCVFKKPVLAHDGTPGRLKTNMSFLSNVVFINCSFESEVNFRGARNRGLTDFTGSLFRGNANFEEITCFDNASFARCSFDEDVRYQNSIFIKPANFMRSVFNKNTSFQSVTFYGDAQFSDCEFIDHADLSLLDCRDNVIFTYTRFLDHANFSYSTFAQRSDFIKTSHVGTDMSSCNFMGISRWNEVQASDKIDFSEAFFLRDDKSSPTTAASHERIKSID